MTDVPIPIQRGMQYIGVDGVQLITPLFYVDNIDFKDKWAFEVELDLSLSSIKNVDRFPQKTHWFVVVDHSYPFGSIYIYPSKEKGITKTYHHQDINLNIFTEVPWRYGKICIDKPIRGLGIVAGPHDPIGECEERMKWGLERALAWIRAAATNSLIQKNDPYETPYYLYHDGENYIYDESPNTYSCWKSIKPGEWGYVIWDMLDDIKNTVFATAYFSRKKLLIRGTPRYNEDKNTFDNPKTKIGVWWYWPSTVVINSYQAPTTWGELREAGRAMHIQVDQSLQSIAKDLSGRVSVPLMIGYPIPKRIGVDCSEVHWQVMQLENILPPANKTRRVPKGFRTLDSWQRYFARTRIYPDNRELRYAVTENWHPDRLQARGRLSESLRKKKILLIGCGALGSNIAELLARGGVETILIMDPDILSAGNLVRHTLSGNEIGEFKAAALTKRLSSSAPFANIKSVNDNFPVEEKAVNDLIEEYDVIIDCSAEDEVIGALSLGYWSVEKLFISAFVGYKARSTYIYSHLGLQFPFRLFQSSLEPYLIQERSAWKEDGETIEGAGCWSPLFPARMDDLLLSASSTIKVMEELVEKIEAGTNLVIFTQIYENNYQGLKRVNVLGNLGEEGE